MRLSHGLHLAYCTNVHPGENWAETFDSLNRWTLQVRRQVGGSEAFAVGLRLSDLASRELQEPSTLKKFKKWLDDQNCYVFTMNGFPFGRFHGGPVKERVYQPDWTTRERLEYTNRLFDLLVELAPAGLECSVSTLPGSFKEFITDEQQVERMLHNLWACAEHIANLGEKTGRELHLGLEPEPLGYFENTAETLAFFDRLRSRRPSDSRAVRHVGVNYDTCHFAVEFEEPAHAISQLRSHGIRISKIHLSSALKIVPSPAALQRLGDFAEDVYLHQVIAKSAGGSLIRFRDLPPALAGAASRKLEHEEWRVHFHVPLHCELADGFETTSDHVRGVLKLLQAQPGLCSHLEMETYTWAVLPEVLRSRDVSEQLVNEYRWTLSELAPLGIKPSHAGFSQ